MNNDIAISVRNISKAYTIRHNAEQHTMLSEAIMHTLRNPLRRQEKETFWALKDISFDVKKGDVVGIIGRNGAGKSTLLKILSRITEPTTGEILMDGRVGSLLEVGTGFHPELTGRENIYLNGAILGMKRREIDKKFDEIVDFAGVEQFLDTPVKRYSSGMYVRLAFAVAAHLNPETLIVDEVLSVGDAEFQKKCLGKMGEVAKSGRTVLFVSHNMAAVRQLTKKTIYLSNGSIVCDGDTLSVIDLYIDGKQELCQNYTGDKLKHIKTANPNNCEITNVGFIDNNGMEITIEEPLYFYIYIKASKDINNARVNMTVFRTDDNPVGGFFGKEELILTNGNTHIYKAEFSHNLAPGKYYCGISVGTGNPDIGLKDYDIVMNVLYFDVISSLNNDIFSSWNPGWGSIYFQAPHFIQIKDNHKDYAFCEHPNSKI